MKTAKSDKMFILSNLGPIKKGGKEKEVTKIRDIK